MADTDLLTTLLKDTSRSFYLTLRLLPAPVRRQIGVAYLLARTSDTVADSDVIPLEERLQTLAALRTSILDPACKPPDLRNLVAAASAAPPGPGRATPGELRLLLRTPEALGVVEGFEPADRSRIRRVLETILGGQILDLERFGGATSQRIVALSTFADTEDYTYRVAGCVGEFWTEICGAHLVGDGGWDPALQKRDGVRFGRGLQWVNILRDIPRDLRSGRCYFPVSELAPLGLEPVDLLSDGAHERLRPLYLRCVRHAREHLSAGWDYTMRIPPDQRRLRVACALPILLGLRTLALLEEGNPLDGTCRIKVSRGLVRQALVRSVGASLGLHGWERLHRWALEN